MDDPLRLENQVCFALVTAARNVVSIYRPVLEPLGLTHPQYLVMLALWERAPRSLSALAGELAMEPATLSPLVKRLEAQGRVRRTRPYLYFRYGLRSKLPGPEKNTGSILVLRINNCPSFLSISISLNQEHCFIKEV